MRYRSEVVIAVDFFNEEDDIIVCKRENGEEIMARNGLCGQCFCGDKGVNVAVLWTLDDEDPFVIWVAPLPAN